MTLAISGHPTAVLIPHHRGCWPSDRPEASGQAPGSTLAQASQEAGGELRGARYQSPQLACGARLLPRCLAAAGLVTPTRSPSCVSCSCPPWQEALVQQRLKVRGAQYVVVFAVMTFPPKDSLEKGYPFVCKG